MRITLLEVGLLVGAAALVVTVVPRCSGGPPAGRAREPDAHARLAEPRRHAGDDPRDDLRARLDAHRPPAGLLHLAAQAPADARVRRARAAVGYQEDHLISLELGGNPTDPRNLWPEPYPRAADVDRIENELNAKVCSGELTLAEAQRQESALKHTAG